MSENQYQGLKLRNVFIDDGMICMETGLNRGEIVIGQFEDLTSLPPYHGGEFVTENGIEINLKTKINSMGLTPKEADEIKAASTKKADGEKLSERMTTFNAYLHNQLVGNMVRS